MRAAEQRAERLYELWSQDKLTRLGHVGQFVFYQDPWEEDEGTVIAERNGLLYDTEWLVPPAPEQLAEVVDWEPIQNV